MTKGELIGYINEYIAEQDSAYKDEYYMTDKGLASEVLSTFTTWLIRKGAL